MKISCVLFIVLLAICANEALARSRVKRETCTEKGKRCWESYRSRSEYKDKITSKFGESNEGNSVFECCNAAVFAKCFQDAEEDCNLFEKGALYTIGGGVKLTLELVKAGGGCGEISPTSFQCLAVEYAWWIVGVIAIIVILSVALCVVRCCCRR